jgi:hypothetical protein
MKIITVTILFVLFTLLAITAPCFAGVTMADLEAMDKFAESTECTKSARITYYPQDEEVWAISVIFSGGLSYSEFGNNLPEMVSRVIEVVKVVETNKESLLFHTQ